MVKKLKVFGGHTFYENKQVRTLVVAYTKKQAAELIGVYYKYFSEYFIETGNSTELSVATEIGVYINKGYEYKPKFEDFIKIK